MPTLAVSKADLLSRLDREYTDDEFSSLVFDFGVELDDMYSENGVDMYKFDIPANRYDLLCIEGFARALGTYLTGQYEDIALSSPGASMLEVFQEDTHERPYIACAVIRNISMDDSTYASFIGYQDKLHTTIGRHRSLVAIGTHDLDKIDLSERIVYKSVELKNVHFVPLNQPSAINGTQLKSLYKADKKLSKYFDLLSDPSRSVAFVCKGGVMSIPPIINSDRTKISKTTRNIFIDVTGKDFHNVNMVLKLLLYSFRGEHIEPVRIVRGGQKEAVVTPKIEPSTYEMTDDEVNKKLALTLTADEIKSLLLKMIYSVEVVGNRLLKITPYGIRMDIMHKCDIIEDIAISYGFNNFARKIPEICTIGSENLLNKFTDSIRAELALAGLNEALTLTLLSHSENIVDSSKAAVLSNPKSREYEVVRTSLLPGLLKTISSNLKSKIPIKIFEVADVVHTVDKCSARNIRYCSGLQASNSSMLEDIQGPLSQVLSKCGLGFRYRLNEAESNIYLQNQHATVLVGDVEVGSIGVLHPSISKAFKIPYAMSAFEIDLQRVFGIYMNKV